MPRFPGRSWWLTNVVQIELTVVGKIKQFVPITWNSDDTSYCCSGLIA
jgi:hypothetical protein